MTGARLVVRFRKWQSRASRVKVGGRYLPHVFLVTDRAIVPLEIAVWCANDTVYA